MIRYVVAAIFTVAVVGMAMTAADRAAGINGERAVETEISTLEDDAVSLYQEEELPPEGHPGPRRTVTLELPSDTARTERVAHFEIEPITANETLVLYRIEGRATQQVTLQVPMTVTGADSTIEVTGPGTLELRLTLERDPSGEPIVRVGYR